jgi:hypothetical protein
MIFEVYGNSFTSTLDADKLSNFIFNVLKAYMAENEYFDENTFMDFLEERDEIERTNDLTPKTAVTMVSSRQIEEWLEDIEEVQDASEPEQENRDAENDENEFYDDEPDDEDDDE